MDDITEEKPKINEKDIEKDFIEGLKNVANENPEPNSPDNRLANQLTVKLDAAVIKSLCWGENFILHKLATRDVPHEIAEAIKPLFKPSNEEVELTKAVLDIHAPGFMSPEVIELINKWGCLGPLIQYKTDQYNAARAEVRIALNELKNKGA